MNMPMVKRLIMKDLYLCRTIIWRYCLAMAVGALALYLSFGRGMMIIALQVMLGAFGVHILFMTVLGERTQRTLSFALSLPITVTDYTLAKITANLLMFGTLWLALTIWVFLYLYGEGYGAHAGALAYATIILGEFLLAFCVVFAVAIISESLGWVLFAIAASMLIYGPSWAFLEGLADIDLSIGGTQLVWSNASLMIVALEVVSILAAIGAIFYFQKRKTDFS